jgi:hypothetical protein
MSSYYGDYAEDAVVTMSFNTYDADGASVTVTDLATTDVSVYKDGVILADPDAGVTLILNAGTGNGSHIVKIDTSSDAQYVTGSDYEVRFEGITIDTQTINMFVGDFSIQNRFMRGTDGANTVVPPTVSQFNARTIPSADYLVESDTLARVTLVDTTTENSDMVSEPPAMVGTDDAALASVLGPAVGANISADIAAIPTTMVGTDNAALASVCTETRLVELDAANLPADIDGIAVQTTRVDGLIEDSGGDRYTAKSLEQAPTGTGSGLTAQQTRDAMKLAPTAGSPGTGSIDERLIDIETDTDRVDALIEDDTGDQFTEKALNQAPSGSGGDATEAKQDEILGNFFPDEVFVPAAGTIRYNKKGTVTQLSKKNLKDPDGSAVDSTEDIIATATEI